MALRTLLVLILAVVSVCWTVPVGASTTATLARREAPVLRIGYLRGTTEGSPTAPQLEALADFLERQPDVAAELRALGLEGVGLFACDGGEDQLRRLNAREFDFAFVSSRTFGEHRSGYRVLLQSRRPGDIFIARGGRVLRRGCVFVSARHPLFEAGEAEAGRRLGELRGRPLAVVSSQSLAGYVAPFLALERDHGVAPGDVELLWFDSSEEAIKAVVSGFADAGVCEEGAIERVLIEAGLGGADGMLLRPLLVTEPVPADPVIARAELALERSPLARAVADAIVEFARRGGAGDLQFHPAGDEAFAQVPRLLREFAERPSAPGGAGGS